MSNRVTNLAGGGTERDSGIELLKVFAIIIIVLSHVVQYLGNDAGAFIHETKGFLDLQHSTNSWSHLFLVSLRYCGGLGNKIFLLSTSWFLCDSKRTYIKKAIRMLIDVWIVSVAITIVALVFTKYDIGLGAIIKSFFPTLFGQNWYASCYILFILIIPYFNKLLDNISKREHIHAVLFLGIIYLPMNMIIETMFVSRIIVWITVYFIVSYIKKFKKGFADSYRVNLTVFVLGVCGNTLLLCLTNWMGLHFSGFDGQLQRWYNQSNIFLLMIAFALFNIMRQTKFKSRFINELSGLSLLIYLIHGHQFMTNYFLPSMWLKTYLQYGYDKLAIYVLTVTAGLFVISALIGWIYKKTIERVSVKICDQIYDAICKATKIFDMI